MFALLRNRASRRKEATPIVPAAAFRAAPHVVAAEGEGRVILLDTRRERYLGLDEVGSALWSHLQAGRTVREMTERLASEYEGDVTSIEADVTSFLGELRDSDLIVSA